MRSLRLFVWQYFAEAWHMGVLCDETLHLFKASVSASLSGSIPAGEGRMLSIFQRIGSPEFPTSLVDTPKNTLCYGQVELGVLAFTWPSMVPSTGRLEFVINVTYWISWREIAHNWVQVKCWLIPLPFMAFSEFHACFTFNV